MPPTIKQHPESLTKDHPHAYLRATAATQKRPAIRYTPGEENNPGLQIVRITAVNIALLDLVDDDIFDVGLEHDRINRFVSAAATYSSWLDATPS